MVPKKTQYLHNIFLQNLIYTVPKKGMVKYKIPPSQWGICVKYCVRICVEICVEICVRMFVKVYSLFTRAGKKKNGVGWSPQTPQKGTGGRS